MESNHQTYSHIDSSERIKDILDSAETFEEVNEIPTRNRLTYSNGFYVNCSALFVDIRGSSQLPAKHSRPVLGKIYRAFLSECVSVINSNLNCREIFINGDCVSGILNTPYKEDINAAFYTAATLNSMLHILNWKLQQKGYTPISCGIGIAYGRALMLKAGYKGSTINDVIWMGDVVNEASNLCHQGNKGSRMGLQVSTTVQNNLNDHYKGLLSPVHLYMPSGIDQYEGSVINLAMEKWLQEQKENASKLVNVAEFLRAMNSTNYGR